jgi:hypothetical protein
MIEQNMCKDVRVGCDDQNSKECLKKINQVILVFYEDLNMMSEPIYRPFAIYLCIVALNFDKLECYFVVPKVCYILHLIAGDKFT